MHAKAFVVAGQFTEADLKELLETIRRIERRHPEITYKVAAMNNDMSMDDALDLLKRTFPYVQGQEPTFTTRKNESVP
jgi:hypothetical protein